MTALTVPAVPAPSRTPQLASFRSRCEEAAGRALPGAEALHAFSVTCPDVFWRTLLDWSALLTDGDPAVVRTSEDVQTARFFPDLRLSYAENLLRPLPDRDDDAVAVTSVHQGGVAEHLSRRELRAAVRRTMDALADLGIGAADRVILIAPNSAPTAVAALAVAGVGATLSTASTDMGPSTLLGRFEQVEPGTLLVDRAGPGTGTDPDQVLAAVLAGLPTVRRVLVLDDLPLPEAVGVEVLRLAELVAGAAEPEPDGPWPRFPFNHPLWVMFSSGTTGPPKAMVHGAGGSLLEHVKEHRLHGDLRADDTLYFHTSTGWMMWNWQLSALAVGAHVVFYDGPVSGPGTLWELAAEHGVTVLGTSPAYLQLCEDEGYRPAGSVDLGALRSVLSTGAVLHDWQFDWFADAVGPIPLQSISGGTDIVGCFVLGHPERPVRRGRAQSLSLGLDVAALDADGQPVLGRPGELVCRRPFPSRPLGFLRDDDGRRFTDAYFAAHPGIWTHGDVIDIDPDGSARMHGRSDGVLNVDGVRIGPSEIYTIVRRLPEIVDAMAVEQREPGRPGSSRLVLVVVLRPGATLDDALAQRVRAALRREGSPAHVPSLLLEVPELPRTHSGKPSESAARCVINGDPVPNIAALRNPASLTAIAAALERRAATARPAAGAGTGGDDAEDAVARTFREVLGATIPDDADFFDAGGTSRQSMSLLRRLRVELGSPLPMEAFLADPTISGTRALLATGAAEQDGVSVLRVLRPGADDQPPLVILHGAHGDVDGYWSLVGALEPAGPVLGVSSALTDEAGTPLSVGDLAARHADTIAAAVPTGPVRLLGYSFGGLLGVEVAVLLRDRGRAVDFLGILDSRPPRALLRPAEIALRRFAGLLALLSPLFPEHSLRGAVRGLLRPGSVPGDQQLLHRSGGVYESWRPSSYDGPVVYFRTSRRIPVVTHLMFAWRRSLPQLRIVDIPGTHQDLLAQGYAPVLAARVSAALQAAG